MKKTKLLVGILSLPTLAMATVPLTGCSLFTKKITLTFNHTNGVTFEGESAEGILVKKFKKGSKWKDIKDQIKVTIDTENYIDIGWFNSANWNKITDETILNDNLNLTYWTYDRKTEVVDVNIKILQEQTIPFKFVKESTSTFKEFKEYYKDFFENDPVREGYTFAGWYLDGEKLEDDSKPFTKTPLNIEAKFFADFTSDNWTNLIENANKGLDNLKFIYQVDTFVGLTRTVKINGLDHIVRVIDENHDDLSDGSGKAALTFQLEGVVCGTDGNALYGKWGQSNNYNYASTSDLYKTLNDNESVKWYEKENESTVSTKYTKSCLTMLTDENPGLVIKKVKKQALKCTDSGNTWKVDNYDSYLFPLTCYEYNVSYTYNEGMPYKYWTEAGISKAKADLNGNVKKYWLLTPANPQISVCPVNSTFYMSENGTPLYCNHYNRQAISFAFCI